MHACIHRGAEEIGGSCVELQNASRQLILDVGRPLDAPLDEILPLPAVRGFDDGDPSLLGVIVSHGHPDHFGLAEQLHPAVPVYLGEATARILRAARFFGPAGADIVPDGYLRDRERLELGAFRVTPYLVDHSAFDAYALLVEGSGRRLFYSGDLRGHGRKAARFQRLIERPPDEVDVLLLEGTHVRPDRVPGQAPLSETDVENRCAELFYDTEGLVLAAYSAQNVDRLVTLYKAARRAGRKLVLDLYGATIAAATGSRTIPQSTWDGVRVYVPLAQRIRVKRAQEFERVDRIRRQRVFADDLAQRAGELVLTFRASMMRELDKANCLTGAQAIWSLWPGYLESPSGQAVRRWLEGHRVALTVVHASGHAPVADLQRLAEALRPGRVVPIHTAAPRRFPELFSKVELHPDGQWWSV